MFLVCFDLKNTSEQFQTVLDITKAFLAGLKPLHGVKQKFPNISRLATDFLNTSKKPSKSLQKASKCIPIASLNSEKHSTYLQKCHRIRRSDSKAILRGTLLSKSWGSAESHLAHGWESKFSGFFQFWL